MRIVNLFSRLCRFALLLAMVALATAPSHATKLTAEKYEYEMELIPHSGGALELKDEKNTYSLQDMKGLVFYQPFSSVQYTIGPGIYAFLVAVEVPTVEVVPVGTVPLSITREVTSVKVYWDNTKYPSPQIFYLTGDGTGQLTNEASKWTAVTGEAFDITHYSASPTGYILHKNEIGAGSPEVYYKALQSTISSAQIATYLPTAWVVGKVNVTVGAGGSMELIGLPVYAGKVSTIFSQLGAGKEVILLPRSGGGLDYVTATSAKVVGVDFSIEPTVGFWIKNPNTSALTISFLGKLANVAFTKTLLTFDLTGNPVAIPIVSSILGTNGDIIMPKTPTGSGLDYFVKTAGSWGKNFPKLKMSAGFWYKYSSGSRKWNVKSLLDAAIE